MEPIDLGAAAERVARVAEGIADERLGDPTPCSEYAVREVLAHVAGLSVAFRDAARKQFGPTTDTPPGSSRPVLADDWRTALPKALDELAAAWREPGAWEGDTQAGGIVLPATVMGRIALDELLIHGWDLARASGRTYEVSEEELRVSEALLTPAADASDEGFFGPVVAVPDGAPLLNRVIGLSGRRPDWRPAQYLSGRSRQQGPVLTNSHGNASC
ncbi:MULTISPECIES: TIGR03086 family metal-binding protein [Streptomyces]|uniref:TIGR03086 family metal-binding protein n=1 Tax=Streptomyces solicathayae TaxID=3081768 RepID=A0ABZ0LPC0_9ACTN|nr:TIGR03086 family metal-binding protein [Streptomyces sp. HUAS YS2]WOX20668.1 TIGR03086 family metal-binding protein [Streptomyces sp. HUAS YS2]